MFKTIILICMLSNADCNMHSARNRVDGGTANSPMSCMMDAQTRTAQMSEQIDRNQEYVKVVCVPTAR